MMNQQITLPVWLAILCVLGMLGLGFAIGVAQGARAVVLEEAPVQRSETPCNC